MKKIFLFIVCLTIIFLNYFVSQAQTNNWTRVSSDDGEFSIEVPAKYNFFYDKDGFRNSKETNNYKLQNMYLLNSIEDGALLSFESYESKKGGLDALYEGDKRHPQNVNVNFSEIKSNGTTIRQITTTTDKSYCLRQYFNSKSHIYVLTVASKNSANPTMKRFLDSLVFKPDTKEKPDTNSALFSSLKVTTIKISQAASNGKDTKVSLPDLPAAEGVEPLILIKKPIPAYTDVARMNQIQGTIQIRATFSEDGFIPKMEIIKSLPEGLLRQAIFALLRVKFLPQTKDGKVETVTKVLEYNFSIY
jgi:hypothetical protein